MQDRGAWRRAGSWALAASLGAGGGHGCRTTAFACTTDDQCVDGAASGMCQPSGWCSFEDPACPSMQRYAEHSSTALAGTCVPLEPTDGSTGAAGSSETTAAPGEDTSSSGEGLPLDDTTGSGTSLPPLDTGPDDTSSSGEAASSSGEPPAACEVVLFDDFEDDEIGPQWDPWADDGTSLAEFDSALHFSIVGPVLAGDDAGVLSIDHVDLTGGHLRLELVEPPTPDTAMQLYWQIVTDTCVLQGLVEDGLVYAFDGVGEYGEETQWLQVRFEGGLGHLERSIDGVAWEPVIEPAAVVCEPVDAHVYVFGGASEPTMLRGTAAVGTVEACGAPSP